MYGSVVFVKIDTDDSMVYTYVILSSIISISTMMIFRKQVFVRQKTNEFSYYD
jgi:hypothetical protein